MDYMGLFSNKNSQALVLQTSLDLLHGVHGPYFEQKLTRAGLAGKPRSPAWSTWVSFRTGRRSSVPATAAALAPDTNDPNIGGGGVYGLYAISWSKR